MVRLLEEGGRSGRQIETTLGSWRLLRGSAPGLLRLRSCPAGWLGAVHRLRALVLVSLPYLLPGVLRIGAGRGR